MSASAARLGRPDTAAEAVAWHDAECGGYAADLALWERLAHERPGPILDLGCGTGRVALHLARRGHGTWGVDRDPVLLAELERRAAAASLPVEAACADVRRFALGRRFGLVLAPMQLIQLLGGPQERTTALRSVAAHLAPGGTLALAIVEGVPGEACAAGAAGEPFPLPDVAEADGWVHSSLPLGAELTAGVLAVRRLRQLVSPAGELIESERVDRLQVLDAGLLADEARAAGLEPGEVLEVPATDAHVGSTVLLAEAPR